MALIADFTSAGCDRPPRNAGRVWRRNQRLARVVGHGNSSTIRRGGCAKTVTEAADAVNCPM
jgi:hypothetical protein